MQISHKIELKANNKQITYFKKASGTSRFVWNWALAEWNKQYQLSRENSEIKKPNGLDLKKQFNALKKSEFPWVYEVTKYASQQPFIYLQNAFAEFFQKNRRYPRFKKKGKSKDSFYIGGDQIKVLDKKVKIPLLGWINLREGLRFTGSINGAVVSRTADRWYISFSVETNQEFQPCKNQAKVGVDLGVKTMAILSNGKSIEGPKPLGKLLLRLKRYQRNLSQREKGSNNRQKSQMKVARLHRRIANVRKDALHKLTHDLTKDFQYIAIEDLNVKGMMSNKKLARHIADVGFYEFKRQLFYKAEQRKNSVMLANQWYPSSKLCSRCGIIKKDLTLADRIYNCDCGNTIGRDLNAALNLEKLCDNINKINKNTESSSGIYACGQDGNEIVSFSPFQPAWKNQEYNTEFTRE